MHVAFSVVIPLHNKKEYVLRAVSSVLRQSYHDFEILIINDGSNDGSEKIITQIEDQRIRVFNQSNMGVSAARNKGICEAKNEYVAFLDADDEWDSNFLKEIKYLILKYPNAGIYGVNQIFRYSSGKEQIIGFDDIFLNGSFDGYLEDYFKIFYKYSKSPFCNSGCCMPKKVLLNVNGYKIGVRMTEDSDLWCRIALAYPIAFTKKPLCKYHLETPNSSGYLFDLSDYEVSRMLQNRIDGGRVPDMYIKSVKKLISLQQVSHVKRALLLSYKRDAFKILFDKRIIISAPQQFFILLLSILLPNRLLIKINNLFRNHFRLLQ